MLIQDFEVMDLRRMGMKVQLITNLQIAIQEKLALVRTTAIF